MIIGIPKEIKPDEYRVGIVPAGVRGLIHSGHKVIIERRAGIGSGIVDSEYKKENAEIVDTHEEVFSRSDMIVKVKEPVKKEYPLLLKDQILFTYLHLAPDPELTKALLDAEVVGIAYETVQLKNGTLPLLVPMSEIAGKMAVQEGAEHLERTGGGRGILLGGVSGVERGNVVILGCGVAGLNAAKVAAGMGANVTIIDIDTDKLRYADDIFMGRVTTLMSNSHNIFEAVCKADLVVGSVLVAGGRAPQLVRKDMLKKMKRGTVIVDIAIDQGGCFETSRPTSHSKPTFKQSGVIHYCVTNMPGAVARTSTFALTNATFPYIAEIANKGFKKAMQDDNSLKSGLNTAFGKVTCKAVADALNYTHCSSDKLLTGS